MGEPGTNGNASSPLVRPRSRAKARKVLLGERDYHTWTSATMVNERAEYWLGSNVSFAAGLGLVNLKWIYIVRNRIAHDSGSAKEMFDIERKLIVPGRPHYKSFGPGQVLRHLSNGTAVFIRFADDLGKAADKIAEGP